jgi:hypothetical protein
MGQYFMCVFLAEDGKYIRAFVDPSSYGHGLKLAEHSYVGNSVMNSIEFMLSPSGIFYKSRLVWAGDYADPETSGQDNADTQGPGPNPYTLYSACHDQMDKMVYLNKKSEFQYILNHTKKLFIDKKKIKEIHPLPILVAEGNGSGNGDYYGDGKEHSGTWARDVISVNNSTEGYEEFAELNNCT